MHADWALALDRRGRPNDHARADTMWSQAREVAARIGMTGVVARCDAARPSGVTRAAPAPAITTVTTITITRAGALWLVSDGHERVHVKDSRGMQMLARLVAEPGRELHALDLTSPHEAVDGGDAGALLDPTAREAYRTRLVSLRDALEDAEQRGDERKAMKAQEEIDALTTELARAYGVGGRDRRGAQASERARSNVQRRVAHALQHVESASKRLGRSLTHGVRTGTFCVYIAER